MLLHTCVCVHVHDLYKNLNGKGTGKGMERDWKGLCFDLGGYIGITEICLLSVWMFVMCPQPILGTNPTGVSRPGPQSRRRISPPAMPNGIQAGRDCYRCNAHTSCHPWGDPATWYCYMCCRWFEINDCAEELRRVLFKHAHEPYPTACDRVLTHAELTYRICDVAEDSFADLHWEG